MRAARENLRFARVCSRWEIVGWSSSHSSAAVCSDSPEMRKAGILFTVAGLVAIGVLVYLQGPGAIAEAFGALGAGVLWMVPIYAVFLSLSAISWGMLFAGGRRLGHLPRFTGIWVGASLNTLVPTGTIGGEVVKARIITRYGVGGADAAASVIVDTTVQSLSLALWAFIGTACLASLAADSELVSVALIGASLFLAALVVFIKIGRAHV